MQKVRGHPEGLPLFVGIRFQVLFHSPLGVLFTFPSRYSFTIGHQVVFSLTPWSGQILTEFHVLHDTRVYMQLCHTTFHLRGCHSLWLSFPEHSIILHNSNRTTVLVHAYTPQHPHCNAHRLTQHRFRLFPFRSPLLRESHSFSFPGLT